MTNFPTDLDTFNNPSPSTLMNDSAHLHDAQHTNLNDAVLAMQVKIGIDGSTDPNCLTFKLAALVALTFVAPLVRSSNSISIPKATGSVDGYLAAADFAIFNAKQPALTLGNLAESTSNVLTITGGTGAIIGSGLTIRVKQASGSQSGYVTAGDWTTFNGKENVLTFSGPLSRSVNTISIPAATGSVDGYLAHADWATFNAKQPLLTLGNLTEATSAVLTITGGTGAIIGSGLTIQVKAAGASQNGYLSSADWATFSGKENALTFSSPLSRSVNTISLPVGNLTEATSAVLTITGGTGAIIGSGLTIQVKAASASQAGYLGSADWTTFNGKQPALGYTPANKAGDTFTGTVNLTPAVNTPAMTASGYSVTGSAAGSALTLSGTWNTTGSPAAIKITITDTASATTPNPWTADPATPGAMFLDCLVNDTDGSDQRRFGVSKDGRIWMGGYLLQRHPSQGPNFWQIFIDSNGINLNEDDDQCIRSEDSTIRLVSYSGAFRGSSLGMYNWTGEPSDLGPLVPMIDVTGWLGPAIKEIYGGTHQTSYALGDTLYASATNTLSKLAGNTTGNRKFLRQVGTGSVSAAPAWDTFVSGDITSALGFTPANKAGDTFTGTVHLTPAVNTQALTAASYSLTGSNAQAMLDLAGAWNTTGTPTAIKLTITDTASNAASKLIDVQMSNGFTGTSIFYVKKTGVMGSTYYENMSAQLMMSGASGNLYLYYPASGHTAIVADASTHALAINEDTSGATRIRFVTGADVNFYDSSGTVTLTVGAEVVCPGSIKVGDFDGSGTGTNKNYLSTMTDGAVWMRGGQGNGSGSTSYLIISDGAAPPVSSGVSDRGDGGGYFHVALDDFTGYFDIRGQGPKNAAFAALGKMTVYLNQLSNDGSSLENPVIAVDGNAGYQGDGGEPDGSGHLTGNRWGRSLILKAEPNEHGGAGGDIELNPGTGATNGGINLLGRAKVSSGGTRDLDVISIPIGDDFDSADNGGVALIDPDGVVYSAQRLSNTQGVFGYHMLYRVFNSVHGQDDSSSYELINLIDNDATAATFARRGIMAIQASGTAVAFNLIADGTTSAFNFTADNIHANQDMSCDGVLTAGSGTNCASGIYDQNGSQGTSGQVLTSAGNTLWVDSKTIGAVAVLFDHYADGGNTTTGETDLYSDTIAAGRLANNGEKLYAHYSGTFVQSATATRTLRVYFGGTKIFDSGALTANIASAAWAIEVNIIRVSSAIVRCDVSLTADGVAVTVTTTYTSVGSLTLANTQVLKITGQAGSTGAATNDIVAKIGIGQWLAAA